MTSAPWFTIPARIVLRARLSTHTMLGVFVLALCAMVATPAEAQRFPNRPLRIFVPNPPGGPTDIAARFYAAELAAALGQPVVVDYKPGGNGAVVANATIAAPADGYTLAFSSIGGQVLTPVISEYKKQPPNPDVLNQLTSVSFLADTALVFVVNPKTIARTLQEFIAQAKAQPGKLNYTSTGVGGSDHLSTELFNKEVGISAVHIPHKGAAAALNSLQMSETDYWFAPIGSIMPLYRAGRIKVLANGAARRSPLLPDVPTIAEAAKLPGFDVASWFALFVRTGTDKEIINTLSREIQKIAALPELRDKLGPLGIEAKASTPEELNARVNQDIVKWRTLLEAGGIKLD